MIYLENVLTKKTVIFSNHIFSLATTTVENEEVSIYNEKTRTFEKYKLIDSTAQNGTLTLETRKEYSIIIDSVDTYADLPTAANHTDEVWEVKKSSGIPFINRKYKGRYKSINNVWEFLTGVEDLEVSIKNSLLTKVDKVAGKDLSDNNYTDIEKNKLTDHQNDKSNPHDVTKTQIGLDNVDNTSDINKPIGLLTAHALSTKVDKDGSKVLTTNDYTTVDKNKVSKAFSTDNVYKKVVQVGSSATQTKQATLAFPTGFSSTSVVVATVNVQGNYNDRFAVNIKRWIGTTCYFNIWREGATDWGANIQLNIIGFK